MIFQFLGTSSGVPTQMRHLSGLVVGLKDSKNWYLIDCGEGTQYQLMRTKYTLCRLKGIFITHIHGDHCYGLPGLLATAAMQGRSEPLPIIAPASVAEFIQGVITSTQLGLTFQLEFIDVSALADSWQGPDFSVTAFPLSHRVPSYAYGFKELALGSRLDVEKLKHHKVPVGPVWGQLQRGLDVTLPTGRLLVSQNYLMPGRKARNIVIGGDNDRPELLANAKCDVLVHESTYTRDDLAKVGPKPQHSSAEMIARFAQHAGIPNLVLTHFSARYQLSGPHSMESIYQEARRDYRGELYLARDLQKYWLNREAKLSLLPET